MLIKLKTGKTVVELALIDTDNTGIGRHTHRYMHPCNHTTSCTHIHIDTHMHKQRESPSESCGSNPQCNPWIKRFRWIK